ncbi:SDR family NAD(P)-dependent oxidoreductase [Bradyrhizobium liaoningense]|uniref:SDR family NAD(P)-dependent oxidoreductase n=1 Tax=Bradyrhizobium liaoningense TaxID=43992 RepID=UPI001BAA9321|nr:SDR family oxidoreductase [Bradyrhizobium liaoningense]MBR1167514.1 SDR family oxidoreductase [Bradyrhizobium liaoningense]
MSATPKGTAVVTGASSGIGAIYADRLARRGYDLILVARNKARLDEVASRVASAAGRVVKTITADLNDKADLKRLETIFAADSSITMLVNNAGVGALEPLLRSDISAMEDMIDLNVKALTRLTYAAAPVFVARGGGAIINISSVVAVAPEVLNGVYGGSKAFVLAFTQSLHKELTDKNVRIQVVLPGATATNFWDAAGGAVENLPSAIVMQSDDLVDAALAGFDQGELVTIPSLPEAADWATYERAREKLIPNLSLSSVPLRYRAAAAA